MADRDDILGWKWGQMQAGRYSAAAKAGRGGSSGPSNSEVLAYITGLTTALSATQTALLDTFVTSLKTGLSITNLSDAFDCIWIDAGETQESALKNLVKDAHHTTSAAMPTFTALEGFTGNASSMYLERNWNGRTAGHAVAYTLNSASHGIYFRTANVAAGTFVNGVYSSAGDGGTANRIQIQRSEGVGNNPIDYALNAGTVTSTATAYIPQLVIISRTAANIQRIYVNKNDLTANAAVVSTKIPDQGLVTLARRTTTGAVGLFENNQISMEFLGKGMSATEVGVIHDAFEAYMDANGKGVIA